MEIDGEAHGNDDQEAKDKARTAWLQRNGWKVLRFWTGEVTAEMDWVIDRIREVITGEES